MTSIDRHRAASLDILIDELMTDEELRDSFLRDPERTLQIAGDWGLPLSESELHSLRAPAHWLWDRVTDVLEARLRRAA